MPVMTAAKLTKYSYHEAVKVGYLTKYNNTEENTDMKIYSILFVF